MIDFNQFRKRNKIESFYLKARDNMVKLKIEKLDNIGNWKLKKKKEKLTKLKI